jgi:Icc-related predicted phosphoesterase
MRSGCPHLLEAVRRLQPAYHICGHIHSDHGVHPYDGGKYGSVAINASSVCNYYYTPVRDPIVFDISIPPVSQQEPGGGGAAGGY